MLRLPPFTIGTLLLATLSARALPVTYNTPPEYVAYVEGEDSFENNWTPGESRHFWWKDYLGVTGRGVLDLAASSLPKSGTFTAKFRFNTPKDGTYSIYARMRFPGFMASPFYWSVDGSKETRQPRDDANIQENIVAEVMNKKLALVRLGPFETKAGSHTLTISVRDFVTDGLPYISQVIDSFSVSSCELKPYPEEKPVSDSSVILNANVDPSATAFHETGIHLVSEDWNHYKKLVVPIEVNSKSTENFEGQLRVYRKDGSFTDLKVSIPPSDFGASKEYSFDLATLFSVTEGKVVGGLILLTFDKWYGSSHAFSVSAGPARLAGKTGDAPQFFVVDPSKGMAPPTAKATDEGESGNFVWNDVSNTGGMVITTSQISPTSVFASYADGKQRPVTVEFLTAPLSDVSAGEQRSQFRLTNKSESDIYRVDFGFQGPFTAKDGSFFAGSSRTNLRELPTQGTLIGPQKFTHDWVCLTADGSTVYSYLEDSAHHDSQLQFTRKEGAGLRWGFSKFSRIRPNETWTSPVLVVGRSAGEDWHPSADQFSKWWFSWAAKPNVPDWFRSIGGIKVGLNYPVNSRKSDLEGSGMDNQRAEGLKEANAKILTETREKIGIDWWHNGTWLPLGTEAWYPNGYRLNEQQTAERRKVTDDVRALNGKTSFYTNPLMVSRVAPEYANYKDHSLVTDMDGYPIFSEHTHRHHPMAIKVADEEWGREFSEIILPMVRDARPDALYMDQLGAVPVHLDWTKLPTSRLGLWCVNQGLFCKTVVDRFAPVNPELVTGIEGVNVYAQQSVTYSLLFYEDYSILKYTFPYYTTIVGRYDELADTALLDYAGKALLTGQPLLVYNDASKIEMSVAARIKRIIELKRELDPFLATLRYRDTFGLHPDEGLDAALFENGEGVKVVVVSNRTDSHKRLGLPAGRFEITRRWNEKDVAIISSNTLDIPPDSFGAVELREAGSKAK